MKKINSLQGLRMVMFLLIFIYHACETFVKETWFFTTFLQGAGCMAVSVFFVLSGFVSGISKKKAIETQEEYWGYMKDKAIKFYPMHWFFLLVMIPLRYSFFWKGWKAIGYLLLNFSLLHSWVPDKVGWMSLNVVTWYLSTSLFLYAVTPLLQLMNKRIQAHENTKNYYIMIMCCCVLTSLIFSCLIHDNISYWLYAFPPIRVLDYASGFFMGKLFRLNAEKEPVIEKKTTALYTSKEIFAFLLMFIFLISYPYLDANLRRSALEIPISLFMVYTISQSRGFLSKGLSSTIMVKTGSQSLYYMMSHLGVISFCHIGIWYDFLGQWSWIRWCMIVVSLMLIFISKPIYDFLMNVIFTFFDKIFKKPKKDICV